MVEIVKKTRQAELRGQSIRVGGGELEKAASNGGWHNQNSDLDQGDGCFVSQVQEVGVS